MTIWVACKNLCSLFGKPKFCFKIRKNETKLGRNVQKLLHTEASDGEGYQSRREL